MEKTIIYYSANTEKESFEQKIRDNILKHSQGLPIISVTQKPIDFGRNICVGIQDNCYMNEFRQIRIALENVTTPYVVVTEADNLYPPDYFAFDPPEKGHFYRYMNVWISWLKKHRFYFKSSSDGSQMVDRDMWLDIINEVLKGKPEWVTKDSEPLPRFTPRTDKNYTWNSENPVVTFKTGNGVNYSTAWKKNSQVKSLPFWGDCYELKKELTLCE